MSRIVLASGSAVRRLLIEAAGISVESVPHGIDERAVAADSKDRSAPGVALHLARAKAQSASVHRPDAVVIGADQTLELGGSVLGKPVDMDEARQRLLDLSNQTHRLHSCVAIARSGKVEAAFTDTASLTMRELREPEIDDYLEAAGPTVLSSVGAYQIEGPGMRLFSEVEGDYFTILGLPMLPLLGDLRRLGAIPW